MTDDQSERLCRAAIPDEGLDGPGGMTQAEYLALMQSLEGIRTMLDQMRRESLALASSGRGDLSANIEAILRAIAGMDEAAAERRDQVEAIYLGGRPV